MSTKSHIIKMICYINDYETWDDTIHEHACKFFDNYSVHPSLMLASQFTWDEIDKFANLFNPANIKGFDADINDLERDEEMKSISEFVALDYSLEFCLDKKLRDNYFILVFDEHPTFDGEAVDDEIGEVYQRIA